MTPHAELVERVAARAGLPRAGVARVLNAAADVLLDAVRVQGRAPWPGFGTFRRATRKARRILNPRTGKPMRVPLDVSVAFRVAKRRKARL